MNSSQLKKLHMKILEIAQYFDGFCREHEIEYYLMGGSALGAVRHSGFIPWDDDFDVFMDYENYSKFLKVASSELDYDKFYLQKEDSKEWPLFFSKIRMNNTTFIEKDVINKTMHHGIYIDVMCLNATSQNVVFRYFQYISARMLSASALSEKGYTPKSSLDSFYLKVSSLLVRGFVKKKLLAYVRHYNKRAIPSKFVGHFFGRAQFGKSFFPRNYLGKPNYVDFEVSSLPVPNNVDGYLTSRYGKDYMQLPSEKVRLQFPSHAYVVDTDKSYEDYLDNGRIIK